MGGVAGLQAQELQPVPARPTPGSRARATSAPTTTATTRTSGAAPGHRRNPNDQSYRGSAPSSEPETKAVQELHLSLNAPVLISMHNIAAKVLRPPGHQGRGHRARRGHAQALLGERMAEPHRLRQRVRLAALRRHRRHQGLVLRGDRHRRLHGRDRPVGRRLPRRLPVGRHRPVRRARMALGRACARR